MKRCSRLSGKLPCSFVYLLLSRGKKPVVYAGMTARPLKHRLREHTTGKRGGYTATRGPWSLLAVKAYLSADCALIAERQLKRSKYDKQNWLRRLAAEGGRLRLLCDRHGIKHPLL